MALLVIQSDKCVLLKRLRKLLIMDVDKDGFVTMIDLALLFGFWFGASLILILCYAVFDVCDRKEEEMTKNTEVRKQCWPSLLTILWCLKKIVTVRLRESLLRVVTVSTTTPTLHAPVHTSSFHC